MDQKIIEEIKKEHDYQVEKWGTDFDDKNTINDWNTYICRYSTNAAWAEDKEAQEKRKQLIKVATLAISAIEAIDRNGNTAPRHYTL